MGCTGTRLAACPLASSSRSTLPSSRTHRSR